ncbi:MAG: hypothetical protein NTV22_19295 [bacterium]|nr:hypothetical protein [bacterium]
MKAMIKVVACVCVLVTCAQGAPPWATISSVATNCPTAATWTDYTDFVPDFDVAADGYLYLRMFYATSVPWEFNTNTTGASYNYVFRVAPNLPVANYNSAWQQVLRFTSFNQSGDKVSLCKRNGAFVGPWFIEMQNVGGGNDWSWFSFYSTNAAGVPSIPGVTVDGPANAWRPGNKHPYAVSCPGGFSSYGSFSNYFAVSTSGGNSGDSIANIELRKVNNSSGWGTGNTLAYKMTDGQYKAWSRGMSYKGNTYIWKGPTSSTTADGIWVVTNVVGNSDLVSLAQCVSNAYNLVPVTTMDAGADTWNNSDACGIVAFAPNENVLGKDLVVVSANVNGGTILAFDLANPTAGPVTLWGVSNIFPTGATATLLQLGKAGRFLFVIKGDTAANRVMYRLDMRGLSGTDPYVDITNTSQQVASSMTAFTVAGTNAGQVVGMWYENTLNGSNGPVTVGTAWNVSVPLGQGINTISVKGTNTIGIMAVDSIAITRQNPGEGTPVITITNGNAQIYVPDTSYVLAGTANDNVKGRIWWSNLTANTGGSLPATSVWTITVTGLTTGDTSIMVYGTNWANVATSAGTAIAVGYNYFFALNNVGLPVTGMDRGKLASLGSDGDKIYFSLLNNIAGSAFYRIPSTSGIVSNQWETLATTPALGQSDTDGGQSFAYFNGGIYGFGVFVGVSPWRNAMRYDIGSNTWATGTAGSGVGANIACAVDDNGNVYGGWKGMGNSAGQVQQITAWATGTVGYNPSIGGGAVHNWSATRSASTIYILKQWDAGNSRIYTIPATGTWSGTFSTYITAPWVVGAGTAIQFVPAAQSRYGRDELWALRGNGTSDLAVYDLDGQIWTRITLANIYGTGSSLAQANGKMFLLAGGTEGNSDNANFGYTVTVPEPACAALALCGLLLWRRRHAAPRAR